jgi:hypothetical protein
LLAELKSARDLSDFMLSKKIAKPAQRVDENALVEERQYQLRLDVVPLNWVEKLKEIFAEATRVARVKGYDRIRVHYKNQDNDSASHEFEAHDDDPLAALATRQKTIDLTEPMHYNQKEISEPFVQQLVEVLERDQQKQG